MSTLALSRPSPTRLTTVELRKMTDTRSGFWLQLAVVGLTFAIVALVIAFGHADDQTLQRMLNTAVQPANVLLPVMGVLLVTSEWSQRTNLITFTLVPQRSRVVVAKLAASILLSLAALVIAFAVAAAGTAIAAPSTDHVWTLPIGEIVQIVVALTTGMMGGVAFGAVLLASAPAIVALFALPLVTAAVGSIHAFWGIARWTDPSRSLEVMTEHVMSATEWARAGTTLALWLALPLAIGLWRVVRSEVS
jgi:ABC-type transport system involved in multi-copper enzyme maturation permease subunit